LIENPGLSLEELGAKLGVSKQAVAERKAKLEEEGFTKSFYFWNITPRFECTMRLVVQLRDSGPTPRSVVQLLDRFNPIVVLFRTDPEGFFAGRARSLSGTISEVEAVLNVNGEAELQSLRDGLLQIGTSNFTVQPILFSRLMGEKCDIELKSPSQIRELAEGISRRFSSQASVKAVLYEHPRSPTDQFDIAIIRDKRLQPEPESYERRVNDVIVDYHFTSIEDFFEMNLEEGWPSGLSILYAQDTVLERDLERRLSS